MGLSSYDLEAVNKAAKALIKTLEVALDEFYADADAGAGYEAESAASAIEEIIENVEEVYEQVEYQYRSY